MSAPPSPITPFGAVSSLLFWMAKRAAPLTGIVITIAALLWSDFRRELTLPIGFASSSMLTALPALIAVVCVAVGCIVTAIALPTMVLTHPLRKDDPSLTQLCFPKDSPPPGPEIQRTARIVRGYWAAMGAVSAIAWTIVLAWMSSQSGTPLWAGLLVLLAIILLQSASAQQMLRCALNTHDPASESFYGMLLASLLFQYMVAFWVIYALLNSSVALTNWDVAMRCLASVVIMTVAAIFQLGVAWRVTHGWYPNILKHGVGLALLLLGCIGMIPPLGARIASFALLSTATEGQTCTILLFNPATHDTVPKAIVDTQHPSQSKDLQVVFPSSDTLYVKESIAGPTYFIDLKALVGTDSCVRLEGQLAPRRPKPLQSHVAQANDRAD